MQFEHRWTRSDVNAIGINSSVRYALDLQSNFYVLSASSPPFDLAPPPLPRPPPPPPLVAEAVGTTCNMGSLDCDLSGKQKLFHFRLSDTWTASPYLPPRDSTLGFTGRHLWLFTSHIVILVSWLWSSKTSRSSRNRLSKSVGSFLCGSVCD